MSNRPGTPPDENSYIRYSVKDLLAGLHTKFDSLDARLQTKAEQVDLLALSHQVGLLEGRAHVEEALEKAEGRIRVNRRWLITTSIAIGFLCVALATLLLTKL